MAAPKYVEDGHKAGEDDLIVSVGKKHLILPPMPKYFLTKTARVVRANVHLHKNNVLSNLGLMPCDKDGKPDYGSAAPEDIRMAEIMRENEEMKARLAEMESDSGEKPESSSAPEAVAGAAPAPAPKAKK